MVAFLRLEKLRRPDSLAAGRARRRGDARGAGRRAGPQPRHAVVRLRDVGAGDLVVEVDLVHLEPQLRRAQLAARRPRAAARARPSTPAYWKAENLDDFDGTVWRRSDVAVRGRRAARPTTRAIVKRWTQKIKVSIRNLRTDQFITAGYASRARHPEADRHPDARRALRRAAHAAPRRRLHRDGLHAASRPRPSAAARASTTSANLADYTTIHTAIAGRARAPSASA